MARETRRLKLLERQKRVAAIARREAISALAEAQAGEAQSEKLATCSRVLAGNYSRESGTDTGEELAHRGRFAASLARIAQDAEQARVQSAGERDAASQKLAAREQRLERIEEHLTGEKRETNRAADLRENTDSAMLARKLLRSSSND